MLGGEGDRAITLTDRRQIEFDADTLVRIVGESVREAQRFGLPALRPIGVSLHPQSGEIEFMYGSKYMPRAVRLGQRALGAMLIAYCVRAGIPVPRHASKGICIEAKTVKLSFKSEFERVGTPPSPDRTERAAEAVSCWGCCESPELAGASSANDVCLK
jgi:hypothetical protein